MLPARQIWEHFRLMEFSPSEAAQLSPKVVHLMHVASPVDDVVVTQQDVGEIRAEDVVDAAAAVVVDHRSRHHPVVVVVDQADVARDRDGRSPRRHRS